MANEPQSAIQAALSTPGARLVQRGPTSGGGTTNTADIIRALGPDAGADFFGKLSVIRNRISPTGQIGIGGGLSSLFGFSVDESPEARAQAAQADILETQARQAAAQADRAAGEDEHHCAW